MRCGLHDAVAVGAVAGGDDLAVGLHDEVAGVVDAVALRVDLTLAAGAEGGVERAGVGEADQHVVGVDAVGAGRERRAEDDDLVARDAEAPGVSPT